MRHGVRRRALLRAGITAALAAAATPSSAQRKLSKLEAGYQSAPQGGMSCAVCTQFRPPGGCVAVDGEISPRGWCKLFAMPD
jgi:hypothetical protein